jgi:HEAT repeat protein
MTRTKLFSLACVLGLALLAGDAGAHGGTFRGPNGGVPPGLREPSDPEPPPPPPSEPGGPGPTTEHPDPSGGITPPGGGYETGGSDAPPQTPTPGGGRNRPSRTTPTLTFESWRFWWGYNNDDILNLKSHLYGHRIATSHPLAYSDPDHRNVRDAERPTYREIQRVVIPALLRTIDRKGEHEDIQGGALVALGKVGHSRHLALFRDGIWNRYTNARDQKLDFGGQARESAVLALGLLPDLDAASRRIAREICLEALADEGLRTRERTWAAVCLGLQRDAEAVDPLLAALDKRYADDNIPAGILAGLGLIGDNRVAGTLLGILTAKRRVGGRAPSDRVSAFAGYALGKLGDPDVLPELIKVLKSRRIGRIVKRSTAIAIGTLGATCGDEDSRDKAVSALLRYIRKSGGDGSGENFAIIALSQIGTDRALNALIDIAESGKYGQRPFAGLGLATHIFYRDRDAAETKAESMNPDLRRKIVEKLIKLSGKYKDADTKSAFMLCRGLVKDRTAVDELVGIAAKRSADPTLRGFSCVALGLIGDASDSVKDAMKLALRERKSTDLRRDAATGLGLLRDAEVVKLLLGELEKAKSFAVQGQLIQAIGTIGDHTAIEPLVEILDNKSEPSQTRAMAAVGLGMIGDLRELPALARLSKNYNYRASVPDLDELLFIL